MPQISYWIRIEDNPSFNDINSIAIQPVTSMGAIQHKYVKVEDYFYASFVLNNGIKCKILFNIKHVIGEDIYLVYQFDEKGITKVYLNADEVEFIRLEGA